MSNVHIVARDSILREEISIYLSNQGHDVTVHSAISPLAIQAAGVSLGSVLICQADLPGQSGFSLAAAMRASRGCGAVVITAASNKEDRILGLSLGVDYILPRPVDPVEVGVVVKNLGRRLDPGAGVSATLRSLEPTSTGSGNFGGWCFDASGWTLRAPGGDAIRLSMSECVLLSQLLASPGQVTTREELIDALARNNVKIYAHNLVALVSRLRRKAEHAARGHKLPLLAARNVGYVFAAGNNAVEKSRTTGDSAETMQPAWCG